MPDQIFLFTEPSFFWDKIKDWSGVEVPAGVEGVIEKNLSRVQFAAQIYLVALY